MTDAAGASSPQPDPAAPDRAAVGFVLRLGRALHSHAAQGVSTEMPFVGQVLGSFVMGIADGPTEVHQVTLARQILRKYQSSNELFPAYSLPRLREEALEKYADILGEMEEPELLALA